jgi:glucokinase
MSHPPGLSPYVVGIDIGGSKTKIALVSSQGLWRETLRQMPTPSQGNPEDFLSLLVEQVRGLPARPGEIRGAGISQPGFLSEDLETVIYNPNTPLLVGYPLRRRLAERLEMPVTLEIDCNAAALGEHRFGAGLSVRRLLVLSLGTGVGGGMLVDGTPLRFTSGCCGDIGHVYVGGEARCSAGCRGCLEAMVSVEALSREAAPKSGEEQDSAAGTVRALIEAARAGDLKSAAVLRRAGRYIGIAVASLSSFFQPELVLLAGGISEADDLLTAPANETFQQFAASYFQAPIRKAALGASAALAGAAVSLLYKLKD